jgi:DNA polymerase I-like protein with 3'-5' exonuclease and polymerase domains
MQARNHARKHGFVTLWNGRKRHFYAHEPWTHRKAFNSILQGGAAQIIVESMLRFHRARNEKPYRMRVQVHDSLWFTQPVAQLEEHVEEIKAVMEWPSSKFPVPFPVDWKIIRPYELETIGGNLLGARPGGDDGLGSI